MMKSTKKYLIPIWIVLWFGFSSVCSGDIILSVNHTATISENQITSEIRIHNTGNEPALNVIASATFLDQKTEMHVADKIDIGFDQTAKLVFDLPSHKKGKFPVLIVIRYHTSSGKQNSVAAIGSVQTQEISSDDVSLVIQRKEQNESQIVQVSAETKNSSISVLNLFIHAPDRISVSPSNQTVYVSSKNTSIQFTAQKVSDLPDGKYPVFLIAEYEVNSFHHFVYSNFIIPFKAVPQKDIKLKIPYAQVIGVISAILFLIGIFVYFYRKRQTDSTAIQQRQSIDWIALGIDILGLLIIEWFILSHLSPAYLITQTITTGGDTGSHYYTAQYLKDELLPKGKISGWTPGNYAGFPLLQFYFPLPFLIMCGLAPFITLQIAFKWVTLLGTFLLPISAYTMLRLIRSSFPGPIIGAAFTLPFLFNGANSMWGGNILSTLAGEFTYSLSLSISLIFLGSLYRGCIENRRVILNAFLVFLTGFSHGYTLLFAEAMSLFFLLTPYHFIRRGWYLFRMYALAFCMMAFWLVPLLFYTKYTTAYHLAWVIYSIKEVFPTILIPVLAIAGLTLIGFAIRAIIRIKKGYGSDFGVVGYLLFGVIVSVVMFALAPKLGVVDIRYVPCGQLIAGIMAAYGIGWIGSVLNRWRMAWILVPICLIGIIFWTKPRVGPVPDWCKWNYEGFEAKQSWGLFQDINNKLKGTFQDPRVVYEHASIHNSFGTVRAFESLPLFAGRATLEGLYMQASLSAPFVFYIQSEISKEKSVPFKQYLYSDINYTRARRHLELFNVRDIIAVSSEVKNEIRKNPDYRLFWQYGQYEIWQLENSRKGYVTPLVNEPVLFESKNWKVDSFGWFIRDNLADIHLVFDNTSKAKKRFKVRANSFDTIQRIPIDTQGCQIKETLSNEEILIETNWIGKPLLVKVSYHPNWHVEGADRIYLVSPSFMLIYPQQEKIRLYYGRGIPDMIGLIMTILALIFLFLNIPLPFSKRQNCWSLITNSLNIPKFPDEVIRWNPEESTRRKFFLVGLIITCISIASLSYFSYINEPNRWFNQGIHLKDSKQYEKARNKFEKVIKLASRMSDLAVDSKYYIAICYYLEGNNQAAIDSFRDLIQSYPYGLRCAEAYYHIGLCLFRLNQESEGIATMNHVIANYPATIWAGYAKDRLNERTIKDKSKELPPLNSENIGLYLNEGIRHFNNDELNRAKPIFESIINRFPNYEGSPQALACIALIYYKQGNCEKTISNYQQLIDQYPENILVAEAWYHLGICYERLGNIEKSKEAFMTVKDKYPQTIYGKQAIDKLKLY